MILFRHILELGAGSGLLGLALLKSSEKISSYMFTDYSSMILNLLQQNVLLNFPEDQLNVINIQRLLRPVTMHWFSLDSHPD
jgi:tRNA1(Val) A37 N6-methylase TrmN6